MNFIFQLEHLSQAGSRFSYIIGALGLMFILIACLLWNLNAATAAKGAATAIMSGGLILALGGTLSGYKTSKELHRNIDVFPQHRSTFLRTEKAKVESVHDNWFVYRIFWILIAIGGCILLFTTDNKFWLGVGAGAIFIGIAGVIIEAWSYRINEQYRNLILKEAGNYAGRYIKQKSALLSTETAAIKPNIGSTMAFYQKQQDSDARQ
ncbi:hypothetical protein ACFOWA_10550 [Pedobacter lithocola]|uniref:Uncharacterized protein n=1 Tax=Pedobacter lithocola TaxID=1908239 RepID=A0ABV8PBW7_9SPHI